MDMERSEVGSESLGEKRALENGGDRDMSGKKARGGGEDVELGFNVKKVAEIVLVLAAMGKMRGGRKPTAVEAEMMAEAREKLADVCKEFAPKDIFPRDAFGTVIEDLGLTRLREQRLGNRPPKMSIAEKLQLTKQKMEKSEVFPLHSTMYTPSRLQSNLSGAAENRGTPHAVRVFPSDKANHASISSGSFQHPSTVVHTSPANSRTLPYQLPTSEVRPGVSNVLPNSHLGRDSSSLSATRAERPHFRLDGRSNGSYTPHSQAISAGEHATAKTPTWSMQPQSASFAIVGSDKMSAHGSVKAEGSSDVSRMTSQAVMSKPFSTHTTSSNPMNMQHRMNFVQGPSAADTHNEISKIVQNLLQLHIPEHPAWTPPSRDYMNKALTCQMCKATINDVDTALVCDACERGYHLRCLHCNPKAIPRGEWQEWHCAKCLAISNGKPLPPKYGRVMRNISTPKLSSNTAAGQPSLEKQVQSLDENVSQQMMMANGNSVSSETLGNNNRFADMSVTNMHEGGIDKFPAETHVSNTVERSHEEKLVIESESQPPANSEAVTSLSDHSHALENHQDDNLTRMPRNTNSLSKQSEDDNLSDRVLEFSHSGKKVECDHRGEFKEDKQGYPIKTSGTCTVVGEHKRSSSGSMQEVVWAGCILQEFDGKTSYQSCCINGTVYHVEDYALFSSTGNKYMPNKLKAMWEDHKTSKKWVTVTRCFFPDDLPDGVGRPCAPESNEVYESNHESTLEAGLIHGPCEVLPPSRFSEESAMQTRLGTGASDGSKLLFLCKWFYDETKRLFRDVTC